MSFESLSDEHLFQIAQLFAEACRKETQLYGHEQTPPPSSLQMIWCRDSKIFALASVNKRMWRVCVPILFSTVILQGSCPLYSDLDIGLELALELLSNILSGRQELAACVKSIQVYEPVGRRIGFLSPAGVETLCDVLQMLPDLTSIGGFRMLANKKFIDIVNNHRSLEKLKLCDFPTIYACDVPSGLRSNYLAKFSLEYVWIFPACGVAKTRGSVSAALEPFTSLLDLGMTVKYLGIDIEGLLDSISTPSLSRLRVPPSQLRCVSVWIDRTGHSPLPIYDEVRDVLRFWSRSASASSIPEVEFANMSDNYDLPPPLMPNVRGACLNLRAYTMRPSFGSNRAPRDGQDIWQRGWLIVKAD